MSKLNELLSQLSEWAGEKLANEISHRVTTLGHAINDLLKMSKTIKRSPEIDHFMSSTQAELKAAIRELQALSNIAQDAAWFEYRAEEAKRIDQAMSFLKRMNVLIGDVRQDMSRASRRAMLMAKEVPGVKEFSDKVSEVTRMVSKELDSISELMFGAARHEFKEGSMDKTNRRQYGEYGAAGLSNTADKLAKAFDADDEEAIKALAVKVFHDVAWIAKALGDATLVEPAVKMHHYAADRFKKEAAHDPSTGIM